MLNRINKSHICKSSSIPKSTQDQDLLISRLLENFIEMLVYSYCKDYSFKSCKVSPEDSSRYIECIQLGCFKCDIMSSSPEKLCNIATQHRKLENEIEKRKTKLLCLH
ncbi:hypothetical protein M406DRAFT_262269 [Cryphonectria parasitica EP155]|uniref:Uncharacterized protein n=1 Tax=Cryphonectria parasitica (strain ATCC 38755 / EP155) TaxID=660469 RepID=A0A9P4XZE8_CRYP1|nr:uncharacterized protein M406DRAFT_262269 [Cryphonectria parasitica EP155]KAF3763721.1 hypothetical protein M406DRAFT_262269 [Cryphonectria parasitica EP155]